MRGLGGGALSLLFLGLVTGTPAAASESCQRWGPQISEHLDWVCAGNEVAAAVRLPQRPPLADACRVLAEHVSDLLNQHRRVDEMSDAEFDAALVMLRAGQSACSVERFADGLEILGMVPVRRVTSLLR
jgi:hypothetical protein